MPELIDRIEALGKLQTMYIQIECACGDGNPVAKGVRKAYKAIKRMPTIDTEPVRHGRLIEATKHRDEPELRNCPFCGGEAKYEASLYVKPLQDENGAYVDYDEMYYWERTYCTECGAEISSESDDEEEEITIAKWNRRADNGD